MKVLFLTKYTDLGASSRMRTYQYLQFYREAGIECEVKPFFSDRYLKNLYAGRRRDISVVSSYFRRLIVLFAIFKYDKIFIEKEVFPYFPAIAEYLLFFFDKKYIVDYDDAIFHNYGLNSNLLIRILLKNKIEQVMKYSEVVIAGNNYLAKKASEAGARRIVIVPTVIDLQRYHIPNQENIQIKHKEKKLVVGWIGTMSTFEKHLLFIKDWLIEAQERFNIELHIIGITENHIFIGNNVKFIPWSEETEVENISKIDIGIMPLKTSLWEEGKCAYKIVQYLACGKPVIATDVGMNSELCINGQTGFLADTEERFLEVLSLLLNDEKLRNKMGENGRKLIEHKYNVQVTSKELIKIILKKTE